MHTSRPILAALLILLGTTRSGAAQDTAVTATMLRIVAETADQFRTGRPVWLLADYRFPHLVRGPFPTREAAQLARRDSTATQGLFGPYVTPRDAGADSAPRVVGIRVLLRAPGGAQTTIVVNPEEVDALFFTMTPFDKFVVPYYSRLYGADFARRLRQYALKSPFIPKGHCATRACEPDPGIGRFRVLPPWDPAERSFRGPADSLSR
jgi:hypothetical protein